MKKQWPIVVVILFVAAMLVLTKLIYDAHEQAAAEAAYKAERHLVVYSDLPDDVNVAISHSFYSQTGLRVQITSKDDSTIVQDMDDSMHHQPDILVASQSVLQEEKQKGQLVPFASPATEIIGERFKDGEGCWNGIWYDPLVFVVNNEYYSRRGDQLATWDDLLTDAQLSIVFPDIAAMDMAGDFLCSFVESKGRDNAVLYLRELQSHVAVYSKSMSVAVRRVATGEADVGVVDAATARQYVDDRVPLFIIYPQDGTSYWLTGVATTKWCEDDELAAAFQNWLVSGQADHILREKHIYLNNVRGDGQKRTDAKGRELILLQVKKEYTRQGRQELQDWWIRTVRFGKE